MAQNSMTVDEAVAKAARLAERGDREGAARLYEQVLRANPRHKKARKALRALTGEPAKRAALTEADFQRVADLMAGNRLDAARTEIARLCRLHPEQPALHNLHGVILSRRGEKASALEAFKEALRQEPAFAEALNNLASTLSDLGRYQEALGCYQELVNRGQADGEVHANLARTLRSAGQLENAEEALRRAIKLKPLFPNAYNDLGNLLNDLGRHDEAIAAYEAALQMAPNHRKALANLAQTLEKLQRPVQALEAFRELLEHEPENLVALRGLANALNTLGQRTAAIERYQQVLRLSPDDPVAGHFLAALRGETPRRAHPGYARTVFESYAARFEAHLTGVLAYDLPQRVPSILERLDGEDAWYSRALDLGCGTGLVGAQIRSYCDHLTGVDISEAMIRKAEEKAVYDELQVADLQESLRLESGPFNLVVCADVLVYVGDLSELFSRVFAASAAGARFLFSTELLDSGEYALRPSGRYAHSDSYVHRCAEDAGFTIGQSDHIPLRKEGNDWLTGGLYVLSVPG